MSMKKLLASALGGALLAGSLSGYSTAEGTAESGGTTNDISSEEQFKPYEPFGLTYDAGKNELRYNGRVVRWFEDYYALADGSQAGIDFFNEDGVVDVYAVRDPGSFVRSDDGSFDPGGKLTGIEKFSASP